jgi:hypothetical protein
MAARHAVPMTSATREIAEAGGLTSYGPNLVLVEEKAELLVSFNRPATPQHPFMYHATSLSMRTPA